MRYLALIIAVMIVVPTFGQRKKKDDGEIVPTYTEGIAYALPRTGIKVHVEAIREKFEPGPYAAYAKHLLGINDARTSPSVKWSVTAVQIATFSEPDPDQVHKAMDNVASTISLAPNGCLAGINSSGTATMPLLVQSNKTLHQPDLEDDFSFAYFSDTPFIIPGDSTNNFRPTPVGMEQKAAEAAQRVLDCRMNQYDLAALRIDGEYPDGKAYAVSLEELKRTEQNYIQLFVGRTTYKTESYSFDYVPADNEKNAVIFRISDDNGVVPASDLSGKPVVAEFEKLDDLLKKYKAAAVSENPDAGYDGVYYRMPGVANIKILYGLKNLASARATIAQFGTVAPVPEDLLGGDYSIEFHPETGAIKSVQMK